MNGGVPLGAEVRTITPGEMRERGIVEAFSRVEVVSVERGSPSARAGLRRGMVVTNVNARMMEDASDFPSCGKPGDNFRLSLIGERAKSIQVVDSDLEWAEKTE
jgi:S1-C subfamily serine protease